MAQLERSNLGRVWKLVTSGKKAGTWEIFMAI
jgi:hypothetical protein